MNKIVLAFLALLALTAPALAGTGTQSMTPITDRDLITSQTGAPIEGCPPILRFTNNL